jgi:mono/diheme cytochrome c family protein
MMSFLVGPLLAVNLGAQTQPSQRDAASRLNSVLGTPEPRVFTELLSRGQKSELPDGPEKSVILGACRGCHTLDRIVTSYRTPEEWTALVNNMVANGAPLKEAEIEKVASYLAKTFSPASAQARLKNGVVPPSAMQSPAGFKPVGVIYQIMRAIVIPAADSVWRVAAEPPKDLQGWTAVQDNAITLAEAGNLLLMVNPEKDPGWNKAAQDMIDQANIILTAAQARDEDAVAAAGDKIYNVCAGCHRTYKQAAQ